MASIQRKTRDQLTGAAQSTKDSNVFFITEADIQRILTLAVIESCVKETNIEVEKQEECINTTDSGGRKVFAILALEQQLDCLVNFVENDGLPAQEGTFDSRLPYQIEELQKILKDKSVASCFQRRQWEVFIPFFRKERIRRVFRGETTMPFLTRNRLGEGGFGDIYNISIPDGQHEFGSQFGHPAQLVLKTIKALPDSLEDSDEPDRRIEEESERELLFKSEDRILTLLRTLRHPNIVELLASYTINGAEGPQHNLLFPKADSSLDKLLQQKSGAAWKRHFPSQISFLRQLYGLSAAINALHNFMNKEYDLNLIGCHYDLKPANILVHDGILLLSDFGLSRLRPGNSKSTYNVGEGDYLAPECEPVDGENLGHGVQSRPSDIWSLGCVILEAVTYMNGGFEQVVKLKETRREPKQFGPLKMISTKFHVFGAEHLRVMEWTDNLKKEFGANWDDFFDTIRTMLAISPDDRLNAKKVATCMFLQLNKLVVESSCNTLDSLLKKKISLELQIENDRFLLWCSGAKLLAANRETFPVYENDKIWLKNEYNRFEEIQTILSSINDELLQLDEILDGDDKKWPIYVPLQNLVDQLWALQPRDLSTKLIGLLEEQMMCKDDVQTLAELRKLDDWDEAYTNIARLAAIKYMTATLEDDKKKTWKRGLQLEHELSYHLIGEHRFGQMVISGKQKPVLVERMSYNPAWGEENNKKLVRRIGKWATLLNSDMPDSWRVLKCVGFFHERLPHRFGLAYEFPQSQHPVEMPVTLKRLIRGAQRPVLGQLFKLAFAIANCLLNIHKTSWLHKNLSAQNIIFFDHRLEGFNERRGRPREPAHFATRPPDINHHTENSQSGKKTGFRDGLFNRLGRKESRSALSTSPSPARSPAPSPSSPGPAEPGTQPLPIHPEVRLQKPYLVGFNHTRESGDTQFTTGSSDDPAQKLYQHPEYRDKGASQRFKHEYDYFSLGLILLEIGLWERLESFGREKLSPWWILDNVVPRLGSIMGKVYQDAVVACLDGRLGLRSGEGKETKQQPWVVFDQVVVSQIRACNA